NGRTVKTMAVAEGAQSGTWIEMEAPIEVGESSWIAARASSRTPLGDPNSEAHTNPVYVYLDGKAPFHRDDLDRLVEKLDGQMNIHRTRRFADQARVLDYFQKSRDILLKVREAGGLPA